MILVFWNVTAPVTIYFPYLKKNYSVNILPKIQILWFEATQGKVNKSIIFGKLFL